MRYSSLEALLAHGLTIYQNKRLALSCNYYNSDDNKNKNSNNDNHKATVTITNVDANNFSKHQQQLKTKLADMIPDSLAFVVLFQGVEKSLKVRLDPTCHQKGTSKTKLF